MSTRIHYGIRFPVERTAEFLDATHREGVRLCAERVSMFVEHIKPDVKLELIDKSREMYQQWPETMRQRLELSSLAEFVMDEIFHKNHHDQRRGGFSYYSGWNLWILAGFAYAIPWGDDIDELHRHAVQLLFVEEYGYWDNTDRQKGITERQWEKRRDNWNLLTRPDGEWRNALVHRIVDFSEKTSGSTWEVLEALGCNPWTMLREREQ